MCTYNVAVCAQNLRLQIHYSFYQSRVRHHLLGFPPTYSGDAVVAPVIPQDTESAPDNSDGLEVTEATTRHTLVASFP